MLSSGLVLHYSGLVLQGYCAVCVTVDVHDSGAVFQGNCAVSGTVVLFILPSVAGQFCCVWDCYLHYSLTLCCGKTQLSAGLWWVHIIIALCCSEIPQRIQDGLSLLSWPQVSGQQHLWS